MSKLRSGLVWVAIQLSWPISCRVSVTSVADILSFKFLPPSTGIHLTFLYSFCPRLTLSLFFFMFNPMYWNSATSSDLILNKWQSLSMTLVCKISDPVKQKSSTWVVIIPCSLFWKYHVNMAWSYFETTALDFNNSSPSVKYRDLDASVKPHVQLESFQIYPGDTLASLGGSK